MGETIQPINQGTAYSLEYAINSCVQTQDERGKEWLYKKFYGYLLAIALRYVKNREDAEELVNESFVKIFSRINTFSGCEDKEGYEKLFRAWIAKICVNASIDFLRTKKMLFSDEEFPENAMEYSYSNTSSGLYVEDIYKLLENLSDIQRAIFNLYEIEGFNHEEIAKSLGIPESTSRTYLARAKQKLRILYQELMSVPKY